MLKEDCVGALAEGWHAWLEAKGFDSVEAAVGMGVVLAVKDEAERVRASSAHTWRRASERVPSHPLCPRTALI